MTKDELEKLGYKCRVLNYVDPEENLRYWQWRFTLSLDDDIKEQQWCDGYIFENAAWKGCLQAATAHYLQRLELETLREFVKDVKLYNAKAEYHPYSWLDWMKLKIMGIDAWYESAKATQTEDQ